MAGCGSKCRILQRLRRHSPAELAHLLFMHAPTIPIHIPYLLAKIEVSHADGMCLLQFNAHHASALVRLWFTSHFARGRGGEARVSKLALNVRWQGWLLTVHLKKCAACLDWRRATAPGAGRRRPLPATRPPLLNWGALPTRNKRM